MKRKMYQGLPEIYPESMWTDRSLFGHAEPSRCFMVENSYHWRSLQEVEVVRVSCSLSLHYQVVMNASIRLTSATGTGVYQRMFISR